MLNSFSTICLPYCVKKLNNGRYTFLNREYLPLGFQNKRDCPKCDNLYDKNAKYPHELFFDDLTQEKMLEIAVDHPSADNTLDLFWLYSGLLVSKDELSLYLTRLKNLMKLRVSTNEFGHLV